MIFIEIQGMRMADNQITNRVKAIVAELLGVDPEKVADSSSLTDDFKADSLEVTQVIMEIEAEFDIEFPDDADANILTVGDLVSFVSEAAKSGSSE
jgi:acyl carrier protein